MSVRGLSSLNIIRTKNKMRGEKLGPKENKKWKHNVCIDFEIMQLSLRIDGVYKVHSA